MHPLQEDLEKVLLSESAIQARIVELGAEIARDYTEAGISEVTIVAITNGAIIFTADLIRQLPLNIRLDSVRVSSYRNEMTPVSEPDIIDNIQLNINGEHVLMVDDILDTGRTSEKIIAALEMQNPASIKTCMLLDKNAPREREFNADYVGFSIPNEFVVGYGLDFAERYRGLPCIGVVKSELHNPPEWL